MNLASLTAFLRPTNNGGSESKSHRLPSLAAPIHYELFVRPYLNLTDETFRYSMFDGEVSITMKILQSTDRIVLHKQFIMIQPSINTSDPSVSILRTISDEERHFFTIFFNQTLNKDRIITLTLNYVGELKNDTYGFYLSSYVRSSDKVRRYLVASQMEPISARRALPCFDEPALKATYTITVEHEQQYRAWSNMPVAFTIDLSNGWRRTIFQKTLPMSSYLLALVVADFECLSRSNTGLNGNITTSICAQPEKKNDLSYALDVATKNIYDFEQQYNVSFPLAKVDHIAVPDFDAGKRDRRKRVSK